MKEEEHSPVSIFVNVLGMDERSASLLAHAGVTSLEELAYVPVSGLEKIPGLAPAFIHEFRRLARKHLDRGLGGFPG